ncbi:MAG: hypothetical protein ABW166_00590 [Sedimenticola sp.]
MTCDKGHKSIVVYDSRRYDVLLQSATNALLDGYTNEAISTYGTALERCYEFYVRVVLRSHEIDPKEIEKKIEKTEKTGHPSLTFFITNINP